MKMSQNGIDLLKRFEGLELEAYQDIAGIWTIGYGHTGPDVKPGQRISEREAENLLRQDLRPREQAVERLTNVDLNQNEFDALVSFVYNVGIEAYRGSTARRRLNKGDRLGAADALTWWNKATVGGVLRPVTGLTRRRASERALFLTPTNPPIVRNPQEIAENSRMTPVEDSPRRGGLGESRTIQGATVAGGAGVAASTMGRNDAQELDAMETRIEHGDDLILDDSNPDDRREDSMDDSNLPGARDDAPADDAPSDEAPADPPPAEDDTPAVDDTPTDETPVDDTPPPGSDEEVIIIDGETDLDPGIETEPEPETEPETQPETETTAPSDDDLSETILVDDDRPSKHEKHAADAQIQMALLIMIVLSVAFVIFSRIDDWMNYRR